MQDWIAKLDDFLRLSDREILTHAGTVSHEEAIRKAELEFEKFRQHQLAQPSQVEKDFEEAVKKLPKPEEERPTDARTRRTQNRPGPHPEVRAGDRLDLRALGGERRGGGVLIRTAPHRRTGRGRRLFTSATCSTLRCARSIRNTKKLKARWWASFAVPRGHRRQPRFPHLPAEPGKVLLCGGEPGAGPDAH